MLIAFYPSSVLLSIPLNAYITVFLSIFFSDGHWHCLGVSEVAQSCPILCDPMDCSLPCSSVHGILQARYWSGLPFPSPGDLPDPGIKPGSPALEADALTSEPPGKHKDLSCATYYYFFYSHIHPLTPSIPKRWQSLILFKKWIYSFVISEMIESWSMWPFQVRFFHSV